MTKAISDKFGVWQNHTIVKIIGGYDVGWEIQFPNGKTKIISVLKDFSDLQIPPFQFTQKQESLGI
mgnify:FL=1